MTKKNDVNLKLSLAEILDVLEFQDLSSSFTSLTGIPIAILDLEGDVIVASGWQRMCTEFHRKHLVTARNCQESDTILANQLCQKKKYNVYKCKNGLVDVAVPIIIEGMHLGNLFTGQFLFESPDVDFFTHQAEKYGFNKEDYLEALDQIPVLSPERVELAMDYLIDLTAVICKSGIDKKALLDFNLNLERKVEQRTYEVKREKKFSDSLINSLPGIMYVFDQSGRFRRWNKNFENVTGYSAEEIQELGPLDLFRSVTDKNRIREAIDKVFREGSATVEADFSTKRGEDIPYLFTGYSFLQNGLLYLVGVGMDISDRVTAEKQKESLIEKLENTLSEVKQLSGLLPICSSCKKIRDDDGYWNQIESYIRDHSEAEFSHSICPDCARKLYPDFKL